MVDRYPRIVECLSRLEDAGVWPALIGSRNAELAAISLGRELPASNDFDLQVRSDAFGVAAAIIGAEIQEKRRFDVPTGDGEKMEFVADEATVSLDGCVLQILRPRSKVIIGGNAYDTGFTLEASGARKLYSTKFGACRRVADSLRHSPGG
jgi:hypothetical protein